MGQFAVKIKQMAERLDWTSDKKTHASRLSKSLLDLSNKTTSTTDLRSEEQQEREKKIIDQVLSKLELIETVVENQRNIIGDHEAKLRALENTVRSAQLVLETVKEPAKTNDEECEPSVKETALGRVFDTMFQEKSKPLASTTDTQLHALQEHTDTLSNHEERLQTAIDKIQNIWDIIMKDKESSSQVSAHSEEVKEVKKLVESLRKNLELLKTESHDELQIHQNILNNLFSGFVVAFLLLVFICMFYK